MWFLQINVERREEKDIFQQFNAPDMTIFKTWNPSYQTDATWRHHIHPLKDNLGQTYILTSYTDAGELI